MNRIIFSIVLLLFSVTIFAQGTITVTVTSSEKGTGITEIEYELPPPGAYDITSVEVSFDDGEYQTIPESELSGLLEVVPLGINTLTWTPGEDFADIFSNLARIRVNAVTSTITDIDNNEYRIVRIGEQVWMAENLKTTKYNDDTGIEFPNTNNTDWGNNTAGAYAWYGNDDSNKDLYGALYNWHAVNTGKLCPTGWHVPSDAEWTELVNYVVAQGYPNNWQDPNGTGNALKSCRQDGSPLGGDCDTSEHPRWNSDGTHYGFDEFGFSALPGGNRWTPGGFFGLGAYGSWWSSTETSSTNAWGRDLYRSNGGVDRSNYGKTNGLSLRCVRDLD
jgi:uncharacterized protein (TIGR02145 family)